jgi:hypothetical protein
MFPISLYLEDERIIPLTKTAVMGQALGVIFLYKA